MLDQLVRHYGSFEIDSKKYRRSLRPRTLPWLFHKKQTHLASGLFHSLAGDARLGPTRPSHSPKKSRFSRCEFQQVAIDPRALSDDPKLIRTRLDI